MEHTQQTSLSSLTMSARPQFILASSSPRRRQLLDQLGFIYTVVAVNIDETPHRNESPLSYVKRMALEKAREGWGRSKNTPVLAADTICVLDQQILGKPASEHAAQHMLGKLSGRTHTVITAVSLYNGQHQQRVNKSKVRFKQLSTTEIHQYCQTQEPLGKAGSYALQGHAAVFIETITGSYSGIVGLPLYETAELLNRIGISVFPAKLQQ